MGWAVECGWWEQGERGEVAVGDCESEGADGWGGGGGGEEGEEGGEEAECEEVRGGTTGEVSE